MKRMRKIISIILALIMMLCMSPLSGITTVMSSAAPEEGGTSEAPVFFYVPETIYLKPEASNSASVFQYYADRTPGSSSSLRTGENTTGYIYFSCADATSIGSLTCQTVTSTGAVTADITSRISLSSAGGTSTSMALSITAGSLPTAISACSYQTIKWTITYVKDDNTCTATNYSVCYSPYVWAAATGTSAGFNGNGLTGSDFFVRQTTWIAGVHSVKQATEGDWQGNYSITSPLIDSTAYYHQTSDEPYVLFLNNTGIGAGGYCKRDEDVHYSVGVGYLTVDTSRYSSLNSIPNLQCGMDFNGLGTDKLSKNYQIALYIGAYASNQTEQTGNIAVFPTVCEEADYINNSTNLNYIGRHGGYKLNFSTSVTDLIVRSEAYGYDLERGRSSVGYVHLNTTRVDKSTLRGMIGYAVAQGYQTSDYTSESWANYELQLQKACEKLGQVTNTDISTTALDNAISGLELNNSGEPSRSFTIMFNMNGGTGSVASIQARTGLKAKLPNFRPERSGYYCMGWATDPNAASAE